MILCGCGNAITLCAATYSHTQVFDGFAVIVCFDCPACLSTRGILMHESFDAEELPIAAE
jgi:hypothetical protein